MYNLILLNFRQSVCPRRAGKFRLRDRQKDAGLHRQYGLGQRSQLVQCRRRRFQDAARRSRDVQRRLRLRRGDQSVQSLEVEQR